MGSGLIFVIDDDKANNFLSKIMFNDAGVDSLKQFYMVDAALDELRKVCDTSNKDEFPEIVLLDLNLPVKGGWDFLDELRMLDCPLGTPKIFITTSSDHPRDMEKAKNYPEIIEFLPKPMTLEVAEKIKAKFLTVTNN